MVGQPLLKRALCWKGLTLFLLVSSICLFCTCGDFTLYGEDNEDPVAAATASPTNLSICSGTTVDLDGTGSSDPDGDTLTYAWAFSFQPAESEAEITNPTSVDEAEFVPDVSGDYVITLTVIESDGDGKSDTAQVTVTVDTTTLKADAGADRNVCLDVEVELDGSQSQSPETCDTQGLAFTWGLVPPEGSAVGLDNPDAEKPKFDPDPDVMGEYTGTLTVEIDGETAQDTVKISATPVADPGNDQSVTLGSIVELDGRNSVNPETCSNTGLEYKWAFKSYPGENPPVITGDELAQASFTPGVVEEYVVTLTVTVAADPDFSHQADVKVTVTEEGLEIGDMESGPYTLTLTGVEDDVFDLLQTVLPKGELDDTLTLPDPAGENPPVSRTLPVTFDGVNYGNLNMKLNWVNAQDDHYDILGVDGVDASFAFSYEILTCTATAEISDGAITPESTNTFGMTLTLSSVSINPECAAFCGSLVTCNFDQTIQFTLQGGISPTD